MYTFVCVNVCIICMKVSFCTYAYQCRCNLVVCAINKHDRNKRPCRNHLIYIIWYLNQDSTNHQHTSHNPRNSYLLTLNNSPQTLTKTTQGFGLPQMANGTKRNRPPSVRSTFHEALRGFSLRAPVTRDNFVVDFGVLWTRTFSNSLFNSVLEAELVGQMLYPAISLRGRAAFNFGPEFKYPATGFGIWGTCCCPVRRAPFLEHSKKSSHFYSYYIRTLWCCLFMTYDSWNKQQKPYKTSSHNAMTPFLAMFFFCFSHTCHLYLAMTVSVFYLAIKFGPSAERVTSPRPRSSRPSRLGPGCPMARCERMCPSSGMRTTWASTRSEVFSLGDDGYDGWQGLMLWQVWVDFDVYVCMCVLSTVYIHILNICHQYFFVQLHKFH